MPGKAVGAGRMRHRVTIQGRSIERNLEGGVKETWLNRQERWAEIVPVSVAEGSHGDRIEAIASHEVTIRTYPDLTHEMRFVWGARVFGIVEILKDLELPDRFQKVLVKEA